MENMQIKMQETQRQMEAQMQAKFDLQLKEREAEMDARLQIRQHEIDVRQTQVEEQLAAILKLMNPPGNPPNRH